MLNCTDSSNSQSPGNGYFDFILRNPYGFGDITMIDQAINRGPTLVTCWIGNNDILGGATSGEPEVGVNITPTAAFQAMYEGILDKIAAETMVKSGWEPMIITANIPAISSAPYFMPPEIFEAIVGSALPYVEEPVYVLFPALSYMLGGGSVPLPAEYTLDQAEVDVVEAMVVEYNDVIATAAAARGIMVYDANAALAGMSTAQRTHFLALLPAAGYDVATAASMTEFSLDGIHPNSHGYSLVAQGFLDLINGAFGTVFEAPYDASTWDPTYGVPAPTTAAAPEAFTAIKGLFN
jgi:lysophospholipase L1-like esterase